MLYGLRPARDTDIRAMTNPGEENMDIRILYGAIAAVLLTLAPEPAVSQSLIEPFVNYNLDKGWCLITDMIITANWEASSENKWTVPLGGGFGRIFKIGDQAINSRLEAYYNVERPDGAPNWQLTFTWQLLFPK